MRSPGHGYTLINATRPLDAAASAPLSASGSYGPQLLVEDPNTLPQSVLNFFLDYATPGYTAEGSDRRGLQPRLGDRRPDHDLGIGPGRDG